MGISVIGADSEGNNFSVDIGASGNEIVVFDKEYAAGVYSITSQLADSTLDVYAVNADGTLAGYTNTKALSCSKGFSKLVIYGATTNDLLTFEFKLTFSPTQSGTFETTIPPFLSSASPTTLESVDDTTTVIGGNFANDVEIVFTGQDDVDRPAKNIVRSSSTNLIVTRPDVFPVEQEPYSITATNAGVTNPSTNVNKLTDYFDAGGGITWVTTSPLPDGAQDSSYSTTLEAIDADETSVTYSLTAGSLPVGLSLNGSTGTISGAPTTVESQTFTVTATDAGGNSATRDFTLTVFEVPLTVEYLVIAGGGGSGFSVSGGGGAGGYRTANNFLPELSTNYAVSVGAGGAAGVSGGPTTATNGTNSVFASITSLGGGFASSFGGGSAGTGGSGGGAGGGNTTSQPGGAGTPGQGFNGGNGSVVNSITTQRHGGGGGGASQAGESATTSKGGDGGDGLASSITGTSIVRGGGGGGARDVGGGTPGVGGLGGGGNGGNGGGGNNGTVNTGGGAGGGTNDSGASGGSGIVILRYPVNYTLTVGAGLTSSTATVDTSKVTTFTAGTGNVSWS